MVEVLRKFWLISTAQVCTFLQNAFYTSIYTPIFDFSNTKLTGLFSDGSTKESILVDPQLTGKYTLYFENFRILIGTNV